VPGGKSLKELFGMADVRRTDTDDGAGPAPAGAGSAATIGRGYYFEKKRDLPDIQAALSGVFRGTAPASGNDLRSTATDSTSMRSTRTPIRSGTGSAERPSAPMPSPPNKQGASTLRARPIPTRERSGPGRGYHMSCWSGGSLWVCRRHGRCRDRGRKLNCRRGQA